MDWAFAEIAVPACEVSQSAVPPTSPKISPPPGPREARATGARRRDVLAPPKRTSRFVDVAGATIMLLLALPFLVILAIALQIDSPGRLFFVQQRVGRGGAMFKCMKFRTMCEGADQVLLDHLAACTHARAAWAAEHKLRDDPRITRLGGWVRKLSLDEFPQLLNIIRGDMSLVGPRPIVPSEIERYGVSFADYCLVRPGLTGLWQVSGRNDVSYRRRVSMDRYYARRKSLLLDLKILLRTIPAVVFAKGSY